MPSLNPRSLISGAVICVVSIFTVPASQAQFELKRFLDEADEARTTEKILLVYFHSSDIDHPQEFLDVVSRDVRDLIHARATHVDIDVATDSGRELADAFFDYGDLLREDQLRPVLGIIAPHSRRAMMILGGGIGEIQPDSWSRLLTEVAPNE